MQGAGGNPGVGGGSGWRNTGMEREEIHARSAKKYRQGVGRNTGKEREEILGNSRWKRRPAVWEI